MRRVLGWFLRENLVALSQIPEASSVWIEKELQGGITVQGAKPTAEDSPIRDGRPLLRSVLGEVSCGESRPDPVTSPVIEEIQVTITTFRSELQCLVEDCELAMSDADHIARFVAALQGMVIGFSDHFIDIVKSALDHIQETVSSALGEVLGQQIQEEQQAVMDPFACILQRFTEEVHELLNGPENPITGMPRFLDGLLDKVLAEVKRVLEAGTDQDEGPTSKQQMRYENVRIISDGYSITSARNWRRNSSAAQKLTCQAKCNRLISSAPNKARPSGVKSKASRRRSAVVYSARS
jgi:hypothetical protein